MAVHKVMDSSGHTEHAFSKEDVVSLKEAEARFNDLVKTKKYVAFEPGQNGDKGRLVREFEPDTDVIFHPALQGG